MKKKYYKFDFKLLIIIYIQKLLYVWHKENNYLYLNFIIIFESTRKNNTYNQF